MSEPASGARDLDVALLVTGAALLCGTILLVLAPDLRVVASAPRLDLVINTVATLAATGVAAIAFTRFLEQGGSSPALEAAAFAVLAAGGTVFLATTLAGLDESAGFALSAPTQTPVYIWTSARSLAGGLLLAGALLELRGHALDRATGGRLVLMSLILFGLVLLGILGAGSRLPDLITPETLGRLATAPTGEIDVTLLGGALQMFGAALFLGAALAFRRLPRTRPVRPRSFLVVGLLIAAFSQLHFALHPGAFSDLVTTGDVLRLAFYVVLLVAVSRDTRADLRALHGANDELERMHDAEVVRATLEERGRLAREFHDGLAQDLWYAKLKQGRVIAADELTGETRVTAHEVAAAIDSALADARQAVMALRSGPHSDTRFDALLRDSLEDFADRFGLRGTFEADEDLPSLTARRQAEALRIVQEALNNIRKHADATVVRLQAERLSGLLRISVVDNGRGFDPGRVAPDRFGLRTMRERAELIGARIRIESAVSGGTSVVVDIPTEAGA